MERCEACNAPLKDGEVMKCDRCALDEVEFILSSKTWRKVRGPRVVAEYERERDQLRARVAA